MKKIVVLFVISMFVMVVLSSVVLAERFDGCQSIDDMLTLPEGDVCDTSNEVVKDRLDRICPEPNCFFRLEDQPVDFNDPGAGTLCTIFCKNKCDLGNEADPEFEFTDRTCAEECVSGTSFEEGCIGGQVCCAEINIIPEFSTYAIFAAIVAIGLGTAFIVRRRKK